MLEEVIRAIDKLIASTGDALLGRDIRDTIEIEAVIDETAFLAAHHKMVSLIEIHGAISPKGSEAYGEVVDNITTILSRHLKTSAAIYQIFYDFKPEPNLELMFNPARKAAASIDLDVDEIINEKIHENTKYAHSERVFICIYTLPAIINDENKPPQKTPKGRLGRGQAYYAALTILVDAHKEHTSQIVRGLSNEGLEASIITTDDALKITLNMLEKTGDVTFDSITRNNRYLRTHAEEHQEVLPLRISDQIIQSNYRVQKDIVSNDAYLFAPMQMIMPNKTNLEFDKLISAMKVAGVEARLAITLSGGVKRVPHSALLGSFGKLSPSNKPINNAREAIKKEYNSEDLVNMSMLVVNREEIKMSENTPEYDYTQIFRGRVATKEALGSWGGVQVNSTLPDNLEALMASVPLLIPRHIAKMISPPLVDVISMLPINRPYLPWKHGSALFLSSDGKPLPYSQISGQSASVTLVTGPPGYGKSALMGSLNLAYMTEDGGSAAIPIFKGIDFGSSTQGLIDTIKLGMNDAKQHDINYITVSNTADFAANPFDTSPLCRYPSASQKSFLVSFLQVTQMPMEDYKSLPGLCTTVITQAYARYSDADMNRDAKRYSRGTDLIIDTAIESLSMTVTDQGENWWSLADRFFELGEHELCRIAQSYAVPTYSDLSAVAGSEIITQEYNDTYAGQSAVSFFQRTLREVIDQYPILRGNSKFNATNARILILNLNNVVDSVAPQSLGEKQKNAIFYLWALRLLTEDFFTNENEHAAAAQNMPTAYASYYIEKTKAFKSTKKRFLIDEYQRINNVPVAKAQVDQMIEQGRSSGIHVIVASPQHSNFSKAIQELSTSIFICGAGSKNAAREVVEHYGLDPHHEELIRAIKKPGPNGSSAFAIFRTDAGIHKLIVRLIEGPQMLAALATEQDDRYVREQFYSLAAEKRKAHALFAQKFPTGRINKELQRLQNLIERGDYVVQSDNGNLLDDIVDSLVLKLNQS